MSRNALRALARLLAGVLLFAQLAVAAYACPAALAGDRAGLPMAAAEAAAMPGCEAMMEAPGAAMDGADAALCAEHCKVGQQSDQASTLSLPPVLLSVLHTRAWQPEPAVPPRREAAPPGALAAACPSHTLLHCVYRL